jgi:acyl carrier protein
MSHLLSRKKFLFWFAALVLSVSGMYALLQIFSPSKRQPNPKQKLPPLRGTNDAISQKIVHIVVEQLGVNEDEVTPSARYVEDLGADSLDTVELIMAFEKAFDLDIPDEDACAKLLTVQGTIDYVRARKLPDSPTPQAK